MYVCGFENTTVHYSTALNEPDLIDDAEEQELNRELLELLEQSPPWARVSKEYQETVQLYEGDKEFFRHIHIIHSKFFSNSP